MKPAGPSTRWALRALAALLAAGAVLGSMSVMVMLNIEAFRPDIVRARLLSPQSRAMNNLRHIQLAQRKHLRNLQQDADGDGTADFVSIDALLASGIIEPPFHAELVADEAYRYEIALTPSASTPDGRPAFTATAVPVSGVGESFRIDREGQIEPLIES